MSQLQLNNLGDDYKAFPEEGIAPNVSQMPLLLAEGRTPLSVAGLWKRRLEVLQYPEVVMKSWWDNFFDTGDGAVRHSDGSLKIVPDAEYLRSLTPKTNLVDGAVPFSDEAYRILDGEEFSLEQVDRYFNRPFSKEEAKGNPCWLALMRGDRALLNEVVDAAFAQAKERFGYNRDMMGVYHIVIPVSGAAGRLWFVSRLYDYIYDVRANGDDLLDYYDGRLVGVAPEARGAQGERQVLESRV